MKLKLDENIPVDVAGDLRGQGLEVDTVLDEQLSGADDSEVLKAAARDDRVLVTLDKGVADVRRYPPRSFAGIVLLRPPSSGRGAVKQFLLQHAMTIFAEDRHGQLLIVSERGIRLRG